MKTLICNALIVMMNAQNDVMSQLVFCENGNSVDTVVVNEKWQWKEDG
jgi:hypothetical protein